MSEPENNTENKNQKPKGTLGKRGFVIVGLLLVFSCLLLGFWILDFGDYSLDGGLVEPQADLREKDGYFRIK